MKAALYYQSTIAVAIAASNNYVKFYSSGIIDASDCYTKGDENTPINLATQLVGFGTD